jgi:class 3 adenylate cyclase/CHASE2 domain-containing sensor protein
MRSVFFAAVLLLAAALPYVPWLEAGDHAILDAQFRFLRAHASRPGSNEVVIVGIDDTTTRALPEPLTLWHGHLGKFLQAAAGAGAAIVGLDIVLPDRSFEAIVPGYDRQLLAGILLARRSSPVVLALTVDPSGETRTIYPAFVAAAGRDATAYALLPVDSDGVVRRFDERLAVGGDKVATLAGEMARRLGREAGNGLIDYSVGDAFEYVPLQSVLEWYDAGDRAKLEATFKGKVILLGGVFKFEDRLAAPVNLVGWDPRAVNAPGVVLHGQVLRNLLGGGLIERVPNWAVVLLCLLLALSWLITGELRLTAAVMLAGGATLIAASTWLLGHGRYLPLAAALLALTIAVGARVVYETSLKVRERQRLRHAFGAYVSPRIMDDILRSSPPPGLGGERYRLCVLFADIRDFTQRGEQMTPEAVVDLLDRYLSEATASIHGAGGTVDKFMGDGIMAFFGAPQRLDNPSEPAFHAARDMLERVSRLNAELGRQNEPPIAIGIGLHTGDAVVGNIGSETRHNYTAIGDAVNVAARLEQLTKEVGFPLVCSVDVFSMLEDRRGFAKLGARPIKGHRPVEVYGWRPGNLPASPEAEAT